MGYWKYRWIQTPQRILMDPCIKQAPVLSKWFWIIPWPLAYNRLELGLYQKNNQFLIHSWGAQWLSGRVSDSGARGPGFETYLRRVCPWARHFTPRKYWLITQEAMAPSRHDWKIVDRDVKPQHNQPTFGWKWRVFMTIWDCRTHVRMTSSVERTDLDFKISVALLVW